MPMLMVKTLTVVLVMLMSLFVSIINSIAISINRKY